ncbi:MAG: TIGR04283 family arsenosugar biosynthesis glycosyltransferase, partial [Paraperlucidibaca sp.]
MAITGHIAGLSIIVPVRNEAAAIDEIIARLEHLHSLGAEIIVVDGESNDGTPERLALAGFHTLSSRKGRGHQLALGSSAASHDNLLLLHADTILPDHALALIERSLATGSACWGRFDVQIAGTLSGLGMVAAMMNWRSRLTGIATGDHALFMTRAALAAAGGVPEQVLMEDIELSRRLRVLSKPICLRQRVTTSGRRWQRDGLWSTIWLMWTLRWRYWRGASADS